MGAAGRRNQIVKQKVKIWLSVVYTGIFLIFAAIIASKSYAVPADPGLTAVQVETLSVRELSQD